MCYDSHNVIKLKHLGPVVQGVDNIIHQINRYAVDKCWQNKQQYGIHWTVIYLLDGIVHPLNN